MLLTTELDVRVIPNASRDVVVGWYAGALKVKVSAQPESGKANKAVCALLAKELKLQKRAVSVVRGASSQSKRVEILGLSAEGVRERFPS